MQLKRFILLSIFCGVAVAVFADDKTIPLSETPAAVQKTIQGQTGEGTLGDIDKISDGETVYDVGLTGKNGQERDFTVAEDGTLLSAEVAFAQTPAPVQKSVQTLMRQGRVESIDKNLDDSDITYDIEVATTDGHEKDFTLADDGTLLSAEVLLNETPAAVQTTIAAQSKGGKVESIDKNFDDDGINYAVAMAAKDGRETSFTVAANGALASVEVALAQTPRPVQRTIQNQIGEGKVLEIDQSFVVKRGVLPYEVQGLKDGKPFDFSVGPHGRFLGRDD